MSKLLEVRNLYFHYSKKLILEDISFSLNKGEVLSIIGPSGSGKSTLLRAIAMLNPPSGGEIIFRGLSVFSTSNPVDKQLHLSYKRSVGIVFQELYLWPHLNVTENIELPLIKGKGLTEPIFAGSQAAAFRGRGQLLTLDTTCAGHFRPSMPPTIRPSNQCVNCQDSTAATTSMCQVSGVDPDP